MHKEISPIQGFRAMERETSRDNITTQIRGVWEGRVGSSTWIDDRRFKDRAPRLGANLAHVGVKMWLLGKLQCKFGASWCQDLARGAF